MIEIKVMPCFEIYKCVWTIFWQNQFLLQKLHKRMIFSKNFHVNLYVSRHGIAFISTSFWCLTSFTIYKPLHGRTGSDNRVDFFLEVKNWHKRITAKFLDRFNEYLCKVSSKSVWDSYRAPLARYRGEFEIFK